jgi:peptide deformylase
MYGDPVLRAKAVPVSEFDATLRSLIQDMHDTMSAYHGVGLAANQIGVLQRVLLVDVPLDDQHRAQHTLINPEIVERSGSESGEEGCLSIPGIYEDVSRSRRAKVRAMDELGRPLELDTEGYLARAIQHEIDHLDGILFVDRLSPLRRQFLRRSLQALVRGEMPEGYQPPVAPGGSR